MSLSTYTRLTNLIAVRDVLTPIRVSIPASSSLRQAVRIADDMGPGDTGLPYLVRDGTHVVGATYYWDLRSGLEDGPPDDADERDRAGVRTAMTTITPDLIITADTSLWRAARLLMEARSDLFTWFVFDGHEIEGTLTYRDLFKPPFRVCLFAMTVELEQLSLRVCMRGARESWMSLTENRRTRALDAMRRAQERREPKKHAPDRFDMLSQHPELLLEYTTFIDKKTILIKRNLLPKAQRREIEETFDSIEELRNRCAHPDSSDEPFEQPKELLRKVLACHCLLAKIKEVLEPVDDRQSEQ